MAISLKATSRAMQAKGGSPANLGPTRRDQGLGFLVVLWLIVFPVEARAGPPFLTDDPQTVDFQHWELCVASMDFKTTGGWVGDGPHVEINHGVAPNVQLHPPCYFAYQFTFDNSLFHPGKPSPE